MSQKILPVKNNDIVHSVNEFLKELLQSGKISALLVPQYMPSKKVIFPVLISDPHKLDSNVFAPILPASTAKIISKITRVQPSKKPIGVVMHPCQIRAVTELVKLNQANLENIFIIGVDCLGTFPLKTFADFPEKNKRTEFILQDHVSRGDKSEKYMRTACTLCTKLVPINSDITIGIYGMDLSKEILIEANSENGKKLLEHLKLEHAKDMKGRQEKIKEVQEKRNKKLEHFIKEKASKKGINHFAELFDKCINCHNCMKVCPICYCRECLYDSSVFDAEAYKFIRKAETKSLFKMPNDSTLFHLGRMNHMILSCVECGLCEQGCPMDIPLMDIIIPLAENAQNEFKYRPGKDKDEKIPMIVYREDEYVEIGEK